MLLEAVLGPDRFGRLWMPAYGYDVLQDRNAFQTAITRTCSSLPLAMPFADELNDFLLGLLSVDSFTRTALHPHAGQHIWIKDQMKAANEAESLGSPAVGGGGGRVSLRFDIPDEPLDDARLSARRLADNDKDPLVSVLPPIFPPAKTPCIVSARKIMFPRDGVNSNESSSSRKQFD